MKWPATIVAYLLGLRAAGETDFARAWERALVELPAPEPGQGDGDPGLEPFAAFFRRACEREWRGLACADYVGLRDLTEPDDLGPDARRSNALTAGRTVLLG